MDIAAWLRDLGLEQYAQAFRENAIDAAVLPELTADDLNDLGVNLVGHRRRLLGAIAASPRRHPPDHFFEATGSEICLGQADIRQIYQGSKGLRRSARLACPIAIPSAANNPPHRRRGSR